MRFAVTASQQLDPAEIWLCALAFVFSQPEPQPVGRFFNICFQSLPKHHKPEALRLFSLACLNAYARLAEFADPIQLRSAFDAMQLHKALDFLRPEVRAMALPETLGELRRNPPRAPGIPLPDNAFNPWSGLTVPVLFASSEDFPWSTAEAYDCFADSGQWPLLAGGAKALYLPFTTDALGQSCVPSTLLGAYARARSSADLSARALQDHRRWLCGTLRADLSRISPEQSDALYLARKAFRESSGFILADETGLGKGRVLAAFAIACLKEGKKVLFFTEKKSLFSDLWREISLLDPEAALPCLLHPSAKIFSADAEPLAQSPKPKAIQALCQAPPDAGLFFSTYSQLAKSFKPADPKFALYESLARDAVLLLDESHVASGNSKTGENVKALLARCSCVIFSSATFAKRHQSLELYMRAMPYPKQDLADLIAAFGPEGQLDLAKSVSQDLIRNGKLIRREHLPTGELDSQIVYADQSDPELFQSYRQQLSLYFEAAYSAAKFLQQAGIAPPFAKDSLWIKLGSFFARMARNLDLLIKCSCAGEFAADLVQKGYKPIFALESTFESFLAALKDNNAAIALRQDDEDDAAADCPGPSCASEADFSFKKLAQLALDALFEPFRDAIAANPAADGRVRAAYEFASALPALPASPIDLLALRLAQAGVSSCEISGRSMRIDLACEPWKLAAADSGNRERAAMEFNQGLRKAIIITKAGCSGISLHASPDFADASPRAFVELEISPDPAVRIQFLGRARRKGQLSEPKYFALCTQSPFDRRLIERSKTQAALLQHMVGAAGSHAGSIELQDPIFTETGQRLAAEWLAANPDMRERLGISLSAAARESSNLSESLLKRLSLLPGPMQDQIMDLFSWACSGGSSGFAEPCLAHPLACTRSRSAEVWRRNGHAVEALELICPYSAKGPGDRAVEEALRSGAEEFFARFGSNLLNSISISSANAARLSSQYASGPFLRLLEHAKQLRPGQLLRITHPSTGLPSWCLLLSLVPPPNPAWRVLPSCWMLRLAHPDFPEFIQINLGAFFADPSASVRPAKSLPPGYWDQQKRSSHCLTVAAGHPAYARWWAQRFGFTGSVLVASDGQAPELYPSLGASSFENVLRSAWPIADPRNAADAILAGAMLSNAPAGEPDLSICLESGHAVFKFKKHAHDTLCDFKLNKIFHGYSASFDGSETYVRRFCSPKKLLWALQTAYDNGVCLFAERSAAAGMFK